MAATQRQADRGAAWLDDRRTLALVVALGFAVRLLHLLDLRRLPLFDRPTVDAALYLDMARQLGASFLHPDVFYKPPLYPYLLATTWRLVGDDAFLLRLPGAFLGAATCGLAWWLGRRLFDARIAFLAGVLYALHRPAVYFEGELLEIGVVTFLHTAALALVLRAVASTSTRRIVFAAGLALGLGTVARPTLFLFDIVALVWLGRRHAAVAVAGLALAVLPVTLHNAWHGHDLVLVSSNLGVNFHLGNNPRADGRIAASDALPANPQAAERAARDQAEAAAGHPLRASQVSGYWLRRGLGWDFEHPGRALGLAMRKFFFAWNAAEISDNEDLSGLAYHLRVFRVLPVGTWILAPAGLVGLLCVPRRRDRDLARLFVVAQIASLLPFFIVSRFRLPWMPVLAVFAAWTIVTLLQMIRRPQQRSMRLLLASAAAALFCSLPTFGVRARVDFDLDYKLGYAWQQKGRPREALAAYRDAVRRHPDNALACNALGVLLAEQGGDLDTAATWIEKALELDRSRTANYQESLAGVRVKQGDAQRALAACDAGLAADPDPTTRAALQRRRDAALRLQAEAPAPGSNRR